ncbi:MAG: 23S rRNA (pseudouridine(1915)-N(3))-methyltransferase RlmH [Bdellovibrionia bacterium]
MKIQLYAFGKLKTAGLRETADYYEKLLRGFVAFEEIELKPLPVHEKSPTNRKKIQEKEATLLFERLAKEPGERKLIYLLDEKGKARSTREWSEQMRTWESSSISKVVLIIGSSLGFSPETIQKAQGCFSLGPQTLSHELARVVLIEQLYRSLSLLRGHPYHND